MTEVDRLLEEYIAAHRAGGRADPLEYLSRLEGTDRQELAALIDGYLVRAPRREWDAEAYHGSSAERVVESLRQSLEGSSGLWPALLPRLRDAARLKRRDVVSRLAAALGLSGREEKVSRYYHQMEQGLLPADGVSTRVLEALGSILGQSAEALRRAGRALEPPAEAERAAPKPAFARRAYQAYDEAPAAAAPPPEAEEWDEIDQLFRGGD